MLEHFDIVMSFALVMLLLSLVVTTLVQMIIATTGLRGSILKWGIERLLLKIAPGLDPSIASKAGGSATDKNPAHASNIAEAVLRHDMISHVKLVGAGNRRATSIRQEELIQLLDDLASSPSSPLKTDTKEALKKVVGVAQTPEFAAGVERLKTQLEQAFSTEAGRIRQEVETVLADTRKVVSDVGSWFDMVMDRTTENFLLKTRWITASVGLVLAFGLHVDSLQIIRQLATQPELRAKLIQSADATLQKAEGTFALTAKDRSLASMSITMVNERLKNKKDQEALADVPASLVSLEAGEIWLKTKLAASADRDIILNAYREKYEENSKIWLNDLQKASVDLATTLKETNLAIIPNPLPSWCEYWNKPLHFLGTVMTVLFLSLGAPFWYNALRQLANLRPAVAEKIGATSQGK